MNKSFVSQFGIYYFSTMLTLCFNYLIGQRVGSLQHSLLKNLTSSDVNEFRVIREYFFHFEKAYVKKHKPRHVTVLGATNKDLQQAQPFFENHPYLFYAEREGTVLYPEEFSAGNFVVVFLRDLSEETFTRNIKILSSCTECKVLFVSEGVINTADILSLFTFAARQNVGYAEFAHLDEKVVKLYSLVIASNCSLVVRLNLVWRSGINLNDIDTWAFLSRDLNGCPVSVSTSSFEPKMIIQTGKNGSLSIAGGREGELVLVVAKKLNFTVSLRSPSVKERLKYSRKASIVKDVVSGMAEIGIGRLRPTNDLDETIVQSVMYDDECITWGVPRIIKWSNNVVWVEFSWKVWLLVGLVFLVGCGTGYSIKKIYPPNRDGDRTEIGFVAVLLDVLAIHLGNPVVNVPIPAGGKFALILFLCYAMVLTTAYKTSLSSILTTEKGTPTIVDAEGIIKANLNVGGSQYDFNVLNDQVNNSEINMKLVKRFVVNNNDSETLRRLKFHKDFAFLARASSLHDEKQKSVRSQESLSFDVFDTCVLAYHTVMVVRKGSFLRKPVNIVIRRLSEAGILEYWDIDKFDADKILKHRSSERFFENRAGSKFQTIFFLYGYCIAVCVLTFLIELIIPKLNYRKGQFAANLGR